MWLFSPSALAHAHLTSSEPADNATVAASPQALTLTFSEDVEPAFSGITLLGADKHSLVGDKAQQDAQQRNRLILALKTPLAAGDYQVKWHVLSVDGHKTQGSTRFRVK